MTASVIKQQVVVFILGCQHVYIVKETGCVVLKSKTKHSQQKSSWHIYLTTVCVLSKQ